MRNPFKTFLSPPPPPPLVIDRILLVEELQRAGLSRSQARKAKNVICEYLARLQQSDSRANNDK